MTKFKLLLALLSLTFVSSNMSVEASSSNSGCSGLQRDWHQLQKANERFIESKKYTKQRNATAGGQNPAYVVLSCADSRTPPELIFDKGLGKIFCPRVAGNTAGDQVIDSIAFAVKTWDVSTVVVMGHDNCGAVVGALDHLRENGGHIDPENGIFNAVLIPIEKAIVEAGIDIYGPHALEKSIKANVRYVAKQLLKKSAIIRRAVENEQIIIVGSVYGLSSGKAEELFVIDSCNLSQFH